MFELTQQDSIKSEIKTQSVQYQASQCSCFHKARGAGKQTNDFCNVSVLKTAEYCKDLWGKQGLEAWKALPMAASPQPLLPSKSLKQDVLEQQGELATGR